MEQLHRRREFLGMTGAAAAWTCARFVHAESGSGRRVKVGQIGTAHAHAAGKLATLRKLSDDFEVVGIVEPDPELRLSAMKNPAYQDVPWMTEAELLAVPGLQAVAVETEVKNLVPTAARCVAAGMHLHLDKPAGESLPAFRQLLEAATSKKLTVQMGYMFRHNPAFRICFEAVREGWLGRVFEVEGAMLSGLSDGARKRLLAYRGGMMFELGCHLIDATATVLGRPRKITALANQVRPEVDDLTDDAQVVFEYPHARATIRACATEFDGGRRRHFTVSGTDGSIDIRPLEQPKLVMTLREKHGKYARGTREIELPAMPGRYDDHLLELARIVRGEKAAEYGPDHDLLVEEMILRGSNLPVS